MQGELFRAHAHIRPRRENFFAHKARQHGDVETTNTTARPQQGTAETDITTAPENCTKNTHFAPAKAMAVSVAARPAPAKVTGVSDKRAAWPTGPGCGARGRRRGLAGLRGDAPSEARGADGERAGRRPRAHQAARPSRAAHAAPVGNIRYKRRQTNAIHIASRGPLLQTSSICVQKP